jgi:hypothetical protein
MMRQRLKSEMKMKEPLDDEYGVGRINAMIADINAEYAAMGVNVGVTHNTGVVGIEGDEDEDEESDSDHEPRSSKRCVNLYISVCSTVYTTMQVDGHTFVLVSCHNLNS